MIKAYVNRESVKVFDLEVNGRKEDVIFELSLLLYVIFGKINVNSEFDYTDLLLALEYYLIEHGFDIKEYIEKGEAYQDGTK